MEPEFTLEDELLEDYGESAEETVLAYCNRTLEDVIEQYGKVPANMRHAALELVSGSYMNREPYSPTNLSTIPYGNIDVLLKPYIKL